MTRINAFVDAALERQNPDSFVTFHVDQLELDELGIVGESNQKHRGHFVPAGVRNPGFKRKGPDEERASIFNHRQISIIDRESLDKIGDGLDINPDVVYRHFNMHRYAWLAARMGVNLVVGPLGDDANTYCLNDLVPPYHLGPMNTDEEYTAAMLVLGYNEPCMHAARSITDAYPYASEGMARKFMKVAHADRGYVGITSMAGLIKVHTLVSVELLPKVPPEEPEIEADEETT